MAEGEARCLDDPAALAFVEGDCSPAERTAIVAHLTTCASCSELVGGLLEAETVSAASGESGASLETPSELIGPYRFGEQIAEGGMGRIYRAVDTTLGRDVAIKVPRVRDRGLMRRFEREVAITARLQHPGIVPIHGAGVMPDGTPFYVMRFIEGTALDQLVGQAKDLPARLALVKYLLSVGETMAYVHDENVVHRDLKPNNVLVGKFGETLIIDWGIAKELGDRRAEAETAEGFGASAGDPHAIDSDAPLRSSTTRIGDVLGTPTFMAPEQAAGLRVDVRADVYALGCILRYLLFGRITPPGALSNPGLDGVPRALIAVHERATANEPDKRYPDARAFTEALRAALPAPPASARVRRWRWLAPLIGLGCVGAAVGVTLWSSSGNREALPPAGVPARIEVIDDEPPGTRAIAISPSGTRVGFGAIDRLEVRDLVTKETWSRADWIQWPGIVTFETDDVLVYWKVEHGSGGAHQVRWDLRTRTVVERPSEKLGYGWFGYLTSGDIVSPESGSPRLAVVRDGVSRDIPTSGIRPINQVMVAPARKRFAMVDAGALRVVDAEGATFTSPPIADLASLTWLDDDTLLYATGTQDGSTIYRATATPEGLKHPTQVYAMRERATWIGALAAAHGRIVMSVVASAYESHLFGMTGSTDEQLDPVSAGAPFGWLDNEWWLAWNRSTQSIEIRGLVAGALPTLTPAIARGEPMNATRAKDTIIIGLRDERGRRVEAVSLVDGKRLWSKEPDDLAFVRCANDAAPPCVAGKPTAGGTVELRQIDPVTGAVGDVIVNGADIIDAAIDITGTSLVWITSYTVVHARPLTGTGAGSELSRLSGAHSVAFTRDGDVLSTTFDGNVRNIVRLGPGKRDVVVRAGGSIVSMVRPSPNGDHLLYRARTLRSKLVELHLGTP